MDTETTDSVRHYYSEVLKSSQDLKTSASCTIESVPLHLRRTANTFRVFGEKSQHFGLFDCRPEPLASSGAGAPACC